MMKILWNILIANVTQNGTLCTLNNRLITQHMPLIAIKKIEHKVRSTHKKRLIAKIFLLHLQPNKKSLYSMYSAICRPLDRPVKRHCRPKLSNTTRDTVNEKR